MKWGPALSVAYQEGTAMDEAFHEISDVLDRIVREQEDALAAEEAAVAEIALPRSAS